MKKKRADNTRRRKRDMKENYTPDPYTQASESLENKSLRYPLEDERKLTSKKASSL